MRGRTRLAGTAVVAAASTAAALVSQVLLASPVDSTPRVVEPHQRASVVDWGILGRPVRTPTWRPYAVRPNVLMITADDLATYDLRYMPHVRKLLLHQGVTFSDALAPTPVCVPARASLITGQYAHNHGAHTVDGPHGGYRSFRDRRTVAVALQRAGYDTLFVGKYLNGYGRQASTRVPPGWTDWRATLDPSTYDFFHPVINHNGLVERRTGYTTDIMSSIADRVLSKPRRHRHAWFFWLNYVAPHHSSLIERDDPAALWPHTWAGQIPTTVPAPRDRGSFRGVTIPHTPDLFRIPGNAPPVSVSRGHHWTARDRRGARIEYEQRVEAVQDLDRAVASQVAVLRRTHQLHRTIVIFGSDNGFAVGQHNVEGKLWHYDEIVRVPLVMRGPRIPRHRVVRTTVTLPDIGATVLAAARTRSLRRLDGVSILPWLRSPRRERIVPIEGWRVEDGRTRLYVGVRVGSWTYMRYRSGEEEMYDRRRDPYEMRSLAALPAYHRQLRQLRRLTSTYQDCAGTACPKTFFAP